MISPINIAKTTNGEAGFIPSVVLLILLTISHFATIDPSLRLPLMIFLSIAGGSLLVTTTSVLKSKSAYKFFSATFILTFLISLHNYLIPSLTEYSNQKRLYFYYVFYTYFFIFPCYLVFSNSINSRFSRYMCYFSVGFTLLAFTGSASENVRGSEIGLNPSLHSKLLFFPVFWIIAFKPKGGRLALWGVAAALAVLACINTGTRGPLVVLTAVLGLVVLVERRFKFAMKILVLMAITSALVWLCIPYLPEAVTERFSIASLLDQGDEGDRPFLFALALRIIHDSPMGIGMGNMSDHFWIPAPHNIILELMVDLGVLFSLPFIFLLFFAFYKSMRDFRKEPPEWRFIAVWYWFFLFNGMIGGEISFPSILLYLPMGLIVLRSIMSRKSSVSGKSAVVTRTGEVGNAA